MEDLAPQDLGDQEPVGSEGQVQETPEQGVDPDQFVSKESFDALNNKLDGRVEAFKVTQHTQQQVPQQEVPEPQLNITEDQWAEALGNGNIGQLVNQVVQHQTNTALRQFERERINPLEQQGMASLTQLTAQAARSQMPYYDQFKSEIDKRASQMPQQFQTSPEAYKLVHDAVVGENISNIINSEVEKRVRSEREGTGEPGTRSLGMTSGGTGVPGVKELFGADAEKALGGLSADDFSKSLGYESWADYVTKTGVVEA